jgi:hypothetical protein
MDITPLRHWTRDEDIHAAVTRHPLGKVQMNILDILQWSGLSIQMGLCLILTIL